MKMSYNDNIRDRLRKERQPNGCKVFSPCKWLSTNQIRRLFSNFTCKLKPEKKQDSTVVLEEFGAGTDEDLNNVLSDMKAEQILAVCH